MAEKFEHFSTNDMMALASSSTGQQLLSLLQKSGSADLQKALGRAAAGDLAGAKTLLAPLLADPQIRALLEQLGER